MIQHQPLGWGSLSRWGVVLALLCVSLAAVAQDTAKFTFNPPDGLAYVETSRTKYTTTFSFGGHSENEVREQLTKTKTEIHKTAAGFTVTETLLSASETKDGADAEIDSYLKASLNVPVSYTIAKDGKLLSTSGLDKVVANCKKKMSADDLKMMGYLVSEKGMLDGLKSGWYENGQSLIGRTVKTGDSWTITSSDPMPNGKKDNLSITTKMVGKQEHGGRDVVHLQYSRRHDLKLMGEARVAMIKAMLQIGNDGEQPNIRVKEITDEGEMIVDPTTLQAVSRSSSTSTVTTVSGPEGKTLEITEQTDEETSTEDNPGVFTGINMASPAKG